MPLPGDTIAAVATAWGEAGIAIVRLSGPDAVRLAQAVLQFRAGSGFSLPRFLRLASLIDEEKRVVDQVLAVRFAAPKSYTGEDVVEIHTHGGILAAQFCLDALLRRGARLAGPGEFTQRAFLNGRIDLSQSESVLGIIRSRSEEALRAAARTLSGELSVLVSGIREELLNLQGTLEAGLDFPEEIPCAAGHELLKPLSALRGSLEELAERCSAGFLLREGVRVVLAGRPNAGKSSLLNALLKRERAIVTPVPGTTRDVLEEAFLYRGVPFRLVDTAGLRAPSNEIEASGIERARDELRRSDICLWLLDGSAPLDDEDRKNIEYLRSGNFGVRDFLVVLNKSDLPPGRRVIEELANELMKERTDSPFPSPASPVLRLSAETGEGLELLKERVLSLASGTGALDAGFNVTARQLGEIREALLAVSDAEAAAREESGQDIVATLLAASRESLERFLGLSCDDALLENIFSRFCVGK